MKESQHDRAHRHRDETADPLSNPLLSSDASLPPSDTLVQLLREERAAGKGPNMPLLIRLAETAPRDLLAERELLELPSHEERTLLACTCAQRAAMQTLLQLPQFHLNREAAVQVFNEAAWAGWAIEQHLDAILPAARDEMLDLALRLARADGPPPPGWLETRFGLLESEDRLRIARVSASAKLADTLSTHADCPTCFSLSEEGQGEFLRSCLAQDAGITLRYFPKEVTELLSNPAVKTESVLAALACGSIRNAAYIISPESDDDDELFGDALLSYLEELPPDRQQIPSVHCARMLLEHGVALSDSSYQLALRMDLRDLFIALPVIDSWDERIRVRVQQEAVQSEKAAEISFPELRALYERSV